MVFEMISGPWNRRAIFWKGLPGCMSRAILKASYVMAGWVQHLSGLKKIPSSHFSSCLMDDMASPANGSGSVSTVKLIVPGPTPPSFKNRKMAVRDQTNGKLKTISPPAVKERRMSLENAILSELYSESQIIGNETHSECWKRLRTVLSGLCDDSIREIPCGSWDVEYVSKHREGIEIVISLI